MKSVSSFYAWWFVPGSCDKSASMIKLQLIWPHCLLFPISLLSFSKRDLLLEKQLKSDEEMSRRVQWDGRVPSDRQHESAVFSAEPSLSHTALCHRQKSESDDCLWLRATKHQFVTGGRSRPRSAGQVVVIVRPGNNSDWQPVSFRGHGQNQRQWCNRNWETGTGSLSQNLSNL